MSGLAHAGLQTRAWRLHSPMKLKMILSLAMLTVSAWAAESSTYGQRIVAAVLMGEAWGDGEAGMTAVAEVIHNRAIKTARTPLAVVLKKGEFSSLRRTTPEALYQRFCRKRDFQTALRIAKTCYNTPEKLPNLTRGASYFDRRENRPPWLGDVRLVACVGHQNFYVPKDAL